MIWIIPPVSITISAFCLVDQSQPPCTDLVLNGALYGLASHGKFLGAVKPANRRKDVQGLYLTGGASHPGPGMPMVMMSGWIAADSLDSDRK